MNTITLRYPRYSSREKLLTSKSTWLKPLHLITGLLFIWIIYPVWMRSNDPTAGCIAQSTWLLLVLSLLTFLLVVGLCWWLLRHFWTLAGLPETNKLILKFNHLTSCQQLSFFFASFALLILAAMSCIDAIC